MFVCVSTSVFVCVCVYKHTIIIMLDTKIDKNDISFFSMFRKQMQSIVAKTKYQHKKEPCLHSVRGEGKQSDLNALRYTIYKRSHYCPKYYHLPPIKQHIQSKGQNTKRLFPFPSLTSLFSSEWTQFKLLPSEGIGLEIDYMFLDLTVHLYIYMYVFRLNCIYIYIYTGWG